MSRDDGGVAERVPHNARFALAAAGFANPVFEITRNGWCRQPLRSGDSAVGTTQQRGAIRLWALARRYHAAAARRELP